MQRKKEFVVLAQRGTVINLVSGTWDRKPDCGAVFEREPHQEKWKVVKVFTPEQTLTLNALVTLMGGDEKILRLFDIDGLTEGWNP